MNLRRCVATPIARSDSAARIEFDAFGVYYERR